VITEHAVCFVPEGHSLWRHYAIKVQRLGATDSWVLNHVGFYLGLHNEWSPNRPDALRFDERAALEVAEYWAPLIEVNGRTAHEAMDAGLR